MNDGPQLTTFQRKLAERRARDAAASAAARPFEQKFDEDLVPEDPYERSDADKAMDEVIKRIDIIDAYNKYCGKMRPEARTGQREGIKISCPVPGHRDTNPSAWINLDKQTWYCVGCDLGGDSHDLAAWAKGYSVPGYKQGSKFHELRREMAEDYGFTITKLPGGAVMVTEPEPDEEGAPVGSNSAAPSLDPTGGVKSDHDKAVVTTAEPGTTGTQDIEEKADGQLIDLYDDGDEFTILPSFDWRRIIPENTFIDEYMKATVIDDVPEEYHLFHSLLALGFALGRDVRLYDMVPVYGNLFICTLGRSGTGKSKARYHLDTLLNKALPHDWSDPNSKGVRKISSPGSAEVLIHNFQKPVKDPTNPKLVVYNAPVRGLIDYSELASLAARANRQGNAIKPTMMQFYDMESNISTSSMTTGVKEATDPFASALTTTQPKALKELLGTADDSSGFLNRWVFVAGKEKKRFAIGGELVDMTPAVAPLERVLGWAGAFRSNEFIEWSTDAAERFTNFFHSRIEIDKKRSQNDLIIRIDLLMKKLILLFTANRMVRTVPIEAVNEAIAMYDYITECYSIPAEQIGNTFTSEITEAVLYQAKRQLKIDGKGVTISQLARALKRRKFPNKMILGVVDDLVKIGFLKIEKPKAGSPGQPRERFRYSE